MAQFTGCKWKSGPYTNYDAFAKASGLPDDMIEKYRNVTSTQDFTWDGTNFTTHTVSSLAPERTITLQPGKELETQDSTGKGMKLTATILSDSKMILEEKLEIMGWNTMKLTREVKGDKMIVNMEQPANGAKMSQEFTKC